ncbi:MAG: type II toxin-antitoxin system PemK/MazF family toxin [Armatimonadota bacterium]
MTGPARGEVWYVDLEPVRGHEQAGRRPALIVSADMFNAGPAGLVVIVPLTTRDRGVPLHVTIDAPEGGVRQRSFIKCEDVRSVGISRLGQRLGAVEPQIMAEVGDRLRTLLNL